MKKNPLHAERTLTLLNILKEETDPDHLLSMTDLLLRLQEKGITAERKSVYDSLKALNRAGFETVLVRKKYLQGYYLCHPFSPAEILILRDLLVQSVSLSKEETERIAGLLEGLLSRAQAASLPSFRSTPAYQKTDNSEVISVLEHAIRAIGEQRYLDFRYYDLSVTRTRHYRRNARLYHLLPVAVMSELSRFYIVFYSPKYGNFANYRADRMSGVAFSDEISDPVLFDEEAWQRHTFQMYAGQPSTITLECPLSLISQIYDQFGKNLIISRLSDSSFTVHVRSALTPPLVSWILTFYREITVISPRELIDELLNISEVLEKKYRVK